MNKVIHFEVPSEDKDRAKEFYKKVFGWQIEDTPVGNYVYSSAITSPVDENYMHKEAGAINGAIIEKDDQLKSPIITIGVDSIDEHAKMIEAAGGKIVVPKDKVPGMGCYAYFKDSEGNVLGLWENLQK